MTRSRKRRLPGSPVLCLLPLVLLTAAVPGSRRAPQVDAASFSTASGETRTRIYLLLPVSATATEKYLVRLEIRSGAPRIQHEWVVPEDGEARGAALERELDVALPPGKASLRVRMEGVESGTPLEARREVEVPELDRGFAVSDPVLGTFDLENAPRAESVIRALVPRPSRRLAAAEHPGFRVTLRDTLPEDAGPVYTIRFAIRNSRGKTQTEGRTQVPRDRGAGSAVIPLDLHDLASGPYVLRVTAELAGRTSIRDRSFEAVGVTGPLQDPRELRTVLQYVATNEELRALEATPDGDLSAFWEQFWGRRDPDPATPINEAEVEFLRRVAYTTRTFGGMDPGWDTDQGRIYIQLGQPDRIEEVPVVDASLRPTQIWYYYARNLTYVFQDSDGFGHYRLVRNRN